MAYSTLVRTRLDTISVDNAQQPENTMHRTMGLSPEGTVGPSEPTTKIQNILVKSPATLTLVLLRPAVRRSIDSTNDCLR